MAWRTISIQHPAQLSLKDNKLVIKQDETVLLPLEDIDSIVLDSHGITTSANLLVALATHNVTAILCDDKHLPVSIITPYSQHSRQAKVSRQQLTMKKPLQKQLWQTNIIYKINNQAVVLQNTGHDSSQLITLANEVASGDSTNRESVAARLYFSELLNDATRRKPLWYNSALNYGYAIVRSLLARSIASHGLVASQGIFHHSELNAFNLADDLIEAYRPIVDEYVLNNIAPYHVGDRDARLTDNDRKLLIDISNISAIIGEKRYPLHYATDITVGSFVEAISKGEAKYIKLPVIK